MKRIFLLAFLLDILNCSSSHPEVSTTKVDAHDGATVTMWVPSDVAPTRAWYHADSFPFASTSHWGDDSGNGYGLYSASQAQALNYTTPTFSGATGSGPLTPSWHFGTDGGPVTPDWSTGAVLPVGLQNASATQTVSAITASDWKFLSDGSGAFLSMLFKLNGGSSTQALFATCTTTGGPGVYVQADGVTKRLVLVIRNAASEIYRYDGAAGSVPTGVLTQLTVVITSGSSPKVRIWIGNTLVSSGNFTGIPSSAAPLGALHLASYSDGTGKALVSFQDAVFWTTVPSTSDIDATLANLRAVPSQRHDRPYVNALIGGQSNALGHAVFLGIFLGDDRVTYYVNGDPLPLAPIPSTNLFGMELTMAPAIANATGRGVLITKGAITGSKVATWVPGTGVNWPTLVTAIQRALEFLEPGDTLHFVWMQGESDADTTDVPQFKADTLAVIAGVRALCSLNPVWLHMCQINIHIGGTANRAIAAAEAEIVASDPKSSLLNFDDAVPVDVHYTAPEFLNVVGPRVGASVVAHL